LRTAPFPLYNLAIKYSAPSRPLQMQFFAKRVDNVIIYRYIAFIEEPLLAHNKTQEYRISGSQLKGVR